jgi:hypothetical protein
MAKIFRFGYLVIVVIGMIYAGCAGTKTSKEARYLGDWEYLVKDTPNGDVTGVMNITKEGTEFIGKLVSDMGEIALNDLTIVEDKLSANFEIQGMLLDMNGTFDGPQFNGVISIDYNTFTMTAEKK